MLKILLASFIDQQTALTKRATLLNAFTKRATVLKDLSAISKFLKNNHKPVQLSSKTAV